MLPVGLDCPSMRMAGHTRILLGLGLGVVAGVIARAVLPADRLKWTVENIATPVGNVFLALLFMIVVPLIFSALVMGMQELGEARRFGRVGGLALGFTLALSAIACTIALVGVNVVRPGDAIGPTQKAALLAKYSDKKKADEAIEKAKKGLEDPPVLGFIPRNPFKEINRALDGGLLPVMFFALVFGAALAGLRGAEGDPLRAFFASLFAVSQRIIGFAMALAPYAVFALVFRSVAELGLDLLGAVAGYFFLVLGLLALHLFVVYGVFLKVFARRNPLEFFRQIRVVMLTAFATSSSNATLPTALVVSERDAKIPPTVGNFVLTVGATANQNGTALYEGVTILFLAQLFGKQLNLGEQMQVLGLTIVASIGTAGIPAASLPFIATVLATLGIPAESIGIILGIDRLLDMSRTVLNVAGDLTIAACVAERARVVHELPAEALA